MGLRISDSRNFAAGLLYIVFGGGVAIGAMGLNIGTPLNMGAGFFPLFVALALVITGIVVALGAIHRDAPVTGLGRWEVGPIIIVAIAVVVFGTILKSAGLLVSVPVLVGITILASPERSLKVFLISAAALTPLAWLLFIVLLGLPISVFPPFLSN